MTTFQSFPRYSLPIENSRFSHAPFNKPPVEEEREELISSIYYVAFNIVAMILVALGTICNLVNVIVLTRPRLRGVMYIYLLALAATNLSSLILAVPTLLKLANPFELPSYNSYSLAIFVAHIEIPLLNVFIGTSTYIIIFSTINLCIAVYKPIYSREVYTNKNAYLHITISFILNIFIILPHIFMSYFHEVCLDDDEDITCPTRQVPDETDYDNDIINLNDVPEKRSNSSACIETAYVVCINKHYDTGLKIYTYISSFLLRLGPIIFLSVMTVLIIVRFNKLVRRRKEKMKTQNEGEPQPNEEKLHTPEERRMVTVLIAIAITFVICNTPAFILTILFIRNQEQFSRSLDYAIFRSIANNFEILGLCLNLVIYCLCSSDVRKAYGDVLFRNHLVTLVTNRLDNRNVINLGGIRSSST